MIIQCFSGSLLWLLLTAMGQLPLASAQFLTPSLPLIGFDQALQEILDRHPLLAAARAEGLALQAQNTPASLFFLPHLTLTSTLSSPWQTPGNQEPGFTQGLLLNTSWNLFQGGKDWYSWKLAQAQERANQADQRGLRLTLEKETVQILCQVIQKSQEKDISLQLIQTRQALFKIAQERYQRGYLPLQEVHKLEIDLENTRASLSEIEMRLTAAEQDLTALLGHAQLERTWPWKKLLINPALLTDTTSFTSSTLGNLPSWQAAQARLEAQQAQKKRAWSGFSPRLDIGLAYGKMTQFNDPPGWQASLTFSLALLEGLRTPSDIQAETQRQFALESRLVNLERQAPTDWAKAQHSFFTSLKTAQAREKTLILARQLYEDNLKRFQVGQIHSNDLAIDENRLYQTELLAIQGWGEVHQSYAAFCHAQGRTLSLCLH